MTKRGTEQNPFNILLVEDNPGDADLLREAFTRSSLRINVTVAVDGEDAMAFLQNEALDRQITQDLIILDLNLPRMDGREVLKALKADERLSFLPVIVFSSSSAEKDLLEVYRLHGNCFITKPVELTHYMSVAGEIERFWLQAAQIPPRAI